MSSKHKPQCYCLQSTVPTTNVVDNNEGVYSTVGWFKAIVNNKVVRIKSVSYTGASILV